MYAVLEVWLRGLTFYNILLFPLCNSVIMLLLS